VQNVDELIRAVRELGVAVLHEAESNDQPQWNCIPVNPFRKDGSGIEIH
jgi:hypothetical protein